MKLKPFLASLLIHVFFCASAVAVRAMEFSGASHFLADPSQPAFFAHGIIEDGDAERLAALLAPTNGAETILFVSSDGGSVEAAFDVAALISEHGNVRLNVVDRCASACATILFPAARTSELLLNARLGFHSCHEGSTRQLQPECNERIAAQAVERGFPYGAVMMWTQNVPADEVVWVRYPLARCYGYYRRNGDPVPIQQDQPCVRGMMRSMSVPRGSYYYEALLVADCRNPAGNTEFMLCRERELRGMLALAQDLYEIALSHMPEDEQFQLEQQHMDWADQMIASCPAEGILEEIFSDTKRAREPVRCLADRLHERISYLDELVVDLT